jgi:hypothetical protein
MEWTTMVFGWPGALTSIMVTSVGLILRRASLVWVGAFVGLPFMFYLFATPRFWPFAAVAAPCHFGAAAAMARRSRLLAWLLFIPTPLFTWYVATLIAGGPPQ